MFKVTKVDGTVTNVPDVIYLPAKSGETILRGEALVFGTTGLTKCGADVAPEYISLGSVMGTDPDREIAVYRVTHSVEFEVPYTAAPTVGDSVKLDTNATKITATTGGQAKVLAVYNGKATVRF